MKKKELLAFLQYGFMIGIPGLAAKELFEDGCLSDEEFDQMSKEIAGRA